MQKLKRIWTVEAPPHVSTCSLRPSCHLNPTMLAASHAKWLKWEGEHLWQDTHPVVQKQEEKAERPSHMGRISTKNDDGKKQPHLLFLFSLKSVCWTETITLPLSWQPSLKQLPPALLRAAVLLELCYSEVTGRAGFTGLHLQLAVITSTLV